MRSRRAWRAAGRAKRGVSLRSGFRRRPTMPSRRKEKTFRWILRSVARRCRRLSQTCHAGSEEWVCDPQRRQTMKRTLRALSALLALLTLAALATPATAGGRDGDRDDDDRR